MLPARILVVNIGFDRNPTHTIPSTPTNLSMKLETLKFLLMHLAKMAVYKKGDKWTTKDQFKIFLSGFIKKEVAAVPLFGPAIVEFSLRVKQRQ